jgi:glycosyltransferase involved in cell wall biosynthesis
MSRNNDDSMTICLLSRFFDLRNAGVGRFSQEMLTGLKQKGYQVKTVSTNLKGTTGYFLYTTTQILLKIPWRCTVYHSLTPLEAIYIPKNKGIVTFHDLIPMLHLDKIQTHYTHGRFPTFKRFISSNYFELCGKIASFCQTVVCASEYTKQELIKYLNIKESKISVIRYGIDKDFRPDAKKDDIFRIGTLSYLDPRKRIDLLIKAFLEANVNGELAIAGQGIDYPRLKEFAGDDKRIKFLGFVPDEKIVDFYNSLDLFVFPTKVEGYGLPIVEAFACKKPVVVLEDSFMPDDVKSRCAVVENLAGFLKNPEHACDIEENYEFARTHNWDECVAKYIELYKQIGNC